MQILFTQIHSQICGCYEESGVSQQGCQKWRILSCNYQLCKMGLMERLWINSCIRHWLKSSVNVMLSFISERFTTATLAWQFPLFENKAIHQLVSSSIKAKILRTPNCLKWRTVVIYEQTRDQAADWERERLLCWNIQGIIVIFFKLLFLNNQ